MSLAELRACCAQKHGNSITMWKKNVIVGWKHKSNLELLLELKLQNFKFACDPVQPSAGNSYDPMSKAELRACCGKKHGNSIALRRRTVHGERVAKLKSELLWELKQAHVKVPSFGAKYVLMSLKELQACCGKLHGNSSCLHKRTAAGTYRWKTKAVLLLELKQVHSVLPSAAACSPRKFNPLTGGRWTRRAEEIIARWISEFRARKQT